MFVALRPLGYGRWALTLLALNFAWALWDRDHQFLHDRIAGTHIVVDPAQPSRTITLPIAP